MLRLIASDLDGTLLGDGECLPQGVFELIEELSDKGIAFVPASGRQLANVRRLFAPVWRKLCVICEGGALVMRGEERIASCPLRQDCIEEIIDDIRAVGDMELLLSAQDTCYLLDNDRRYVDDILYRLRNNVAILDDPLACRDEYIKIAAFRAEGVGALAPALREKWKGRVHVELGGLQWLDFTLGSKGAALETLGRYLHIAPCDMAAFGDQSNDLSMLSLVGHPYLMRGADPALRTERTTLCDDVMRDIRALCGL